MNKKYAPVIIPTLCRFQHLKRCISSLQNNQLASQTELYIGLDFPAKEEHWKGYQEIKKYLDEGVGGFLNVKIISYNQNQGAEKNINQLKSEVYKKYDFYILTEDDNEFSPCFLRYMNEYLIKYWDDPKIQAITAYAYPIEYPVPQSIYCQNLYFAAYGYGTWKSKELEMLADMKLDIFKKILYNNACMRALKKCTRNQFCNFIKGMLGYGIDLISGDRIKDIDIIMAIWMFFKDKYMIFPTTSMVRNWGFDGSGLNCQTIQNKREECNHRLYNFSNQPIELSSEILYDNQLDHQQIVEVYSSLDRFFLIDNKEFIRTLIAWKITKFIGIKNMRKIVRKIGNRN